MKRIFILLSILISFVASAQSIEINPNGGTSDASAILDLKSTTKGFLPPRMTNAQMLAITSPAQGLIAFCTDCATNANGEYYYYKGTAWVLLSSTTVTSFTYVGAVSGSATPNGATVNSDGVLNLAPANATNPGIVTIGAQTISGVKTFSNGIVGNVTGNAATVTTNANLTGDVTSIGNAATVVKINGTSLSGLATGILKNTTSTGVPTIAAAGTDYQAPITLTTTGSGVATLSSNTLNIPNVSYTLPTATSSTLGGVKPDGTSILNSAGVLSVTPVSIGAQVAGDYLTSSTGVTSFNGSTTGLTPASASNGAVTLGGILVGANGGTGVANTGKTITLGGNLTTSGAFTTALTSTANTAITLPVSGTLATLDGSETLTNKTLTSPVLTGNPTAPTATAGTNNFQLATTAFVATANETNANLTGDVTSIGNAATVVKINGTSLSGLATGILKNTTSTGVPTIAAAGTDYQAPITLTTTGSGVATLSSNTLNIPNASYTLPTATSSTLGGVKPDGTTISITDGVISVASVGGSYIPYTGATGAVNLGDYDLTVNGLTVGKGAGGVFSNTAVGENALKNNATAYSNTAIGNTALYYNTYGNNNTAIGNAALYENSEGSDNTAIGNDALFYNGIGNYNTAIGNEALKSNRLGNYNTAIGNDALFNNMMGDNNTAIGTEALYFNFNGYDNIAIGNNALYFNNGSKNTAIGRGALRANTEGIKNTAIGGGALYANENGNNNTAYGVDALTGNVSGSDNTAFGIMAGYFLRSGSNNTFIGNDAQPSSESANDEITLGNASIAELRAQVTSITALSDRRDKTNIIPIGEGLAFLKKLNPVSFTWNTRDKAKVGIKSAGFIAQDLLALQKQSNIGDNLDLVSENNPEKLEARYGNLLPVIVKAIQEESEEKDKAIQELKTTIDDQQKQIDELKKMMESLLKK
jgi:hypothetical protein